MMDCTQAQEEFAALLDGELAPEERAEVERHLSQCSDCLRDLDGLKRVDTVYRQLPGVSAPEGFEEGVRQATRPKPVLRFPDLRRRRQMSWMVVAAALILLVAGAAVVQFGILGVNKHAEMTVASLEKGVAAPAAEAPALEAGREMVAPQAAKETAPMASPPPAGDMAGVAVEEAPAAPRPPAADVMLMAKPEERPVNAASKPKSAEVEAPASLGVEVQGATPAGESAPAPAETFGAAGARQSKAAQAEMAAPPAPASPAPAEEIPKIMAEPPAPLADKAESDKVEEIGKRVFEQRDGIWYESGYTDQKAVHLVRGSSELRKLVSSHSDLGKVLELGERVVFKTDGKWYRVDPRPKR